MLAACLAAILCGCQSYSAISEWCRNYSSDLLSCLGFHHHTPCAATFYNVLKTIDIVELETQIGHWIQSQFLSNESVLQDYINWPEAKQVFAIEREVAQQGKTSRHTCYGLTNLPEEDAAPANLLKWVRQHWSVERSHWLRDVIYQEDKSQVRVGVIPQVMATLRHLAIRLIKLGGWKSVTKANRFYSANPTFSKR